MMALDASSISLVFLFESCDNVLQGSAIDVMQFLEN
jgi:hypothetical protein